LLILQQHLLNDSFLEKNTLLFLLFIISFVLFSCTASRIDDFSPANKLAPSKLKEDVVVLKKTLEANHPSLYWYTPKDSIDWYFNTTLNSIQDSLTELQFRNKVAKLIARIHCGHTTVRSSKGYAKYFSKHKTPQFPLTIKAWRDSLVVVGNAIKTDSIFKRGTVITSINGMPNRAILDSMFQFISMDGYSDNFKYQLVSIYFPLFYNIAFGLKDTNTISYIDSAGIEKTGIIKNFYPIPDTSRNRVVNNIPFPKPTRKQLRAARRQNSNNLVFDSANTGYLHIITFSGGGLRKLFRESFETLHERHTSNLVIDLRENGGGNIGASANLTRYVIKRPFTVADTVEAISRSFKYGEYIHPVWIYKTLMFFFSKKQKDGMYHFGHLEHHLYQPKKVLQFNGSIYILQGGFTFSAASMFVAHLKGQPNVTVVGEESGGGSYGNTSVHLPSLILPNSQIEIILPIYRIVNDATRPKNGRGVLPDVYVMPSSDAIKNGIDIKMQKVRELIDARQRLMSKKN